MTSDGSCRSRAVPAALLLLLVALDPGATPAAPPAEPPRAATLVLGRVSDSPQREAASLEPLVQWAARGLHDLGVRRGEVRFARDDDEMVAMLRDGRVDWVTESPAGAALFARRAGARVLARSWKGGVGEYRALLFVHESSPARSLADLRSRRVALEDPGSTTGALVPRALLAQARLPTELLPSPGASVRAGRVGLVFAGSELNVFAWVRRGLVDAGATSDLVWREPGSVPESLKRRLRVLQESPPLPRAVELAGPALAPARADRLRALLLGAEQDPAAAAALAAYWHTRRFDALPPGSLDLVERALALQGGSR